MMTLIIAIVAAVGGFIGGWSSKGLFGSKAAAVLTDLTK